MEHEGSIWVSLIIGLVGSFWLLKWFLKKTNYWLHETQVGEKQYPLPPGDLGWPFIGNMWSFLRAFKSTDPDSFMRDFVSRYGNTGIYKCLMFGKPSVFVTNPETCKRVLTDDAAFKVGWPTSTVNLMGRKSFIGDVSEEEHKRLRRLTSAPVNGHEALSVYLQFIEERVVSSLEKWSSMGQIEFLTEIRRITFRIIMHIFLSSESDPIINALEREYTTFNYGVRAMAINLPGFAYHKAYKARKNLVATLESIVSKRRTQRNGEVLLKKKDMLDALLDSEDESGRKLDDEEIVDILLTYLNAGHESSAHTTMWATLLLLDHPKVLQKAKEEQEETVKKRPASQKGLTLKEIRGMDYLDKVIDETLRIVTFSLTVFREAKTNVIINGYTIPKGWKALVWFRTVHFDPEIYPNPQEFNPSRWDNYTPKAGSFLPFGAGTRLCPGNDLAKLEIAIFLHHFLLNYQLVRVNPDCPTMHLPHPRPKDNCLAKIRRIN